MNAPFPTQVPLIELRGIAKRFGGVTALDGVDFELRSGEVHALLGENGAGKSTLIKILGGIHRPDAGEILVDGQVVEIREVTDADRLGIRLIHQELSLAPNLSVAENIFLGREPGRFGFLNRRALFASAQALIAELGLPELGSAETRVADLSVAQQQMTEIARALSTRARILILDEPTVGLDPVLRVQLWELFHKLAAQGKTLLVSSHVMDEADSCQTLILLRDGRVLAEGTPAQLREKTGESRMDDVFISLIGAA